MAPPGGAHAPTAAQFWKPFDSERFCHRAEAFSPPPSPHYCTWIWITGSTAHRSAGAWQGTSRLWEGPAPPVSESAGRPLCASGSPKPPHPAYRWESLPMSWLWEVLQMKGIPAQPPAAPHEEVALPLCQGQPQLHTQDKFCQESAAAHQEGKKAHHLLSQTPGPQAKPDWGTSSVGLPVWKALGRAFWSSRTSSEGWPTPETQAYHQKLPWA